MGLVSRGTKSHGGTSLLDGTTAFASEVEFDIDTLFDVVNGNIDDANVKSGADIDTLKIADLSSTATNHSSTISPGTSPDASHSLPSSLNQEMKQVRYVIERLAIGNDAQRVDATGTVETFWGDLPVRGPNLIKNPNFGAGVAATTTPPTGWTDLGVGTPTYSQVALAGADLSEGKGVALRIEAGSAAIEGCRQTLSGLKASTQYLVVARAKGTSGTVHLRTTGADAASSFRNINVSSSSASFVTLKGVIKTDSTPADIVVQLTVQGNADTNDVQFSHVGVYECSADFIQLGPTPWVISETTTDVTPGSGAETDLGVSCTLYATQGQSIEVLADIPWTRASGTGTVGFFLRQSIAGGATTIVDYVERPFDTSAALRGRERFHYVVESPTAGSSYAFTIGVRTSANTVTVPNTAGAAAVTGQPALKVTLRARSVRVSQ